ncbi:unnamed protein product [Protopolystoma xenopodis]|uniref:Uncharacterized protein n=1 Tax=Protopolystoma xenopodis TaxID=117903 RepID=A0A448WNZ7_9PLAT|nr:unnamed protein product [Protopolystoma xenopodis]
MGRGFPADLVQVHTSQALTVIEADRRHERELDMLTLPLLVWQEARRRQPVFSGLCDGTRERATPPLSNTCISGPSTDSILSGSLTSNRDTISTGVFCRKNSSEPKRHDYHHSHHHHHHHHHKHQCRDNRRLYQPIPQEKVLDGLQQSTISQATSCPATQATLNGVIPEPNQVG